jgi:hypothetical protein
VCRSTPVRAHELERETAECCERLAQNLDRLIPLVGLVVLLVAPRNAIAY